jgi:protein-disulfide isomerase
LLSIIGFLATGDPVVAAQEGGNNAILKRLDEFELLQHRMQQQLEEIKSLLQTRSPTIPRAPVDAAVNAKVTIDGSATLGSTGARLIVVEFADYQCPFCGQYARNTYPEIRRQFVDAGKVLYVFKNFPLEAIHPMALKSAEAAECAGDQDRFWDMHDLLFKSQDQLSPDDIRRNAEILGLSLSQFDECVTSGQMTSRVRANQSEARELGINSTPTFLIAERQLDGAIRVKRKVVGAIPAANFIGLLNSY